MTNAFHTNKVKKKKKIKPQTHLLEKRIWSDVRGLVTWTSEITCFCRRMDRACSKAQQGLGPTLQLYLVQQESCLQDRMRPLPAGTSESIALVEF